MCVRLDQLLFLFWFWFIYSSMCLLLLLFCYKLGEFIHLSVFFCFRFCIFTNISTFRQGSLYFRVRFVCCLLFLIFSLLSLSYFYRDTFHSFICTILFLFCNARYKLRLFHFSSHKQQQINHRRFCTRMCSGVGL